MNILEPIFYSFVMILFPLFAYFLYSIEQSNSNEHTNNVLLDLALYSSLYLILRINTDYIGVKIMFLTVPLLIAYLRNKKMAALIFSLCIALQYIESMNISPIYVIPEFIIYFIFMSVLKYTKESDATIISVFAIIKITFLILEFNDLTMSHIEMIREIIILPFAFYFTVHLICYIISASEKAMCLHMTIKELEHQKQLRDSLFKITHEIKNPIAVCKGYLDMLDIDNEDHIRRYIPIIKQEIERTLTLMNDFMMLTKLNVDRRKMDASVLLQDVCEISSMLIQNKKVQFKNSVIDDEVYISGDYDRLKQVFINVIKNAVEAIPRDRKGVIKFDAKKVANKLIIKIDDNGLGMDEKTLKRIGEAFYTTKSCGTGLGVKFSKEILESHDGTIDYQSKPNIGTTVTISLPIIKNP